MSFIYIKMYTISNFKFFFITFIKVIMYTSPYLELLLFFALTFLLLCTRYQMCVTEIMYNFLQIHNLTNTVEKNWCWRGGCAESKHMEEHLGETALSSCVVLTVMIPSLLLHGENICIEESLKKNNLTNKIFCM